MIWVKLFYMANICQFVANKIGLALCFVAAVIDGH